MKGEDYGTRPEERPIKELIDFGAVVIDKPSGINPHKLCEKIKLIVGAKKAGHSGTLDPNVTGLMIIAFNRATRALSFLTAKRKTYVGTLYFQKDFTKKQVQEIFDGFLGEIMQDPPFRSAVKSIPRLRNVYSFKITRKKGHEVDFEIVCEAGTYIRSIVYDMNKDYGTVVLKSLRRTAIGGIGEKYAHTLQELEDTMARYKEKKDGKELRDVILPVESVLELPRIVIDDTAINALCHGHNLYRPGVHSHDPEIKKGELAAVVTMKGELVYVGISNYDAEEIMPLKKGEVISDIKAVLMKV